MPEFLRTVVECTEKAQLSLCFLTPKNDRDKLLFLVPIRMNGIFMPVDSNPEKIKDAP